MMKTLYTLCLVALFCNATANAQFLNTPPMIQGNVGTGEYANNSYAGSPNGTWHIGWDDTYLYIAVINANFAENMVMYIDGNPISPVNGGSNVNGSLVGLADYAGYTPNLPFRADVRLFTNNAERGIWKSDGSGGWMLPVHGYNAYGFSGEMASSDYAQFYYASYGDFGGNREMKIKWTDMGFAGRPINFNFVAFISASRNIYSLVPQENQPNLNNFDSYYSVVGSSNTTTSPFSMLNHSTALPIEIQSFTAYSKEHYHLLNWQTASEKDAATFNIQRSTDNQIWENIGSVKAMNHVNGSKYSFIDNTPLSIIYYYRLQMVDVNGKMDYSKVVAVIGKNGKQTLTAYPNPVKAELTLSVYSDIQSILIYDMTGRMVRQINDNRPTVNVQELPNGIYFARLLNKNGVLGESVRFVKQ